MPAFEPGSVVTSTRYDVDYVVTEHGAARLGGAALITGFLDDSWLRAVRRWTMISWLFLSIGLGLGMIEGLTNSDVSLLFNKARDAEYKDLAEAMKDKGYGETSATGSFILARIAGGNFSRKPSLLSAASSFIEEFCS